MRPVGALRIVFGGTSEPPSFAAAVAAAKAGVDGIGFGRGGEIDGGLGKGEFALGRTQIVVSILGGVGDNQCLRIGEADVLHRHPHQAPADLKLRPLAGVEHAGEVVESRVGIGAAHRFMQRRDQVVVTVLAFVIDRRAPLDDLEEGGGIERLTLARGTPDLLGERQRGAAVGVGKVDEERSRVFVKRQSPPFGSPRRA